MEKQKKIYVVEDRPVARELLVTLLTRMGYQVRDFGEAEVLLGVLGSDPPDLILTDLQMPGMDGLELLRTVKDRRPEVEIIVVSAFGTIETAVQAIKSGAADFITKPISTLDLELKVQSAFQQQHLKRELERLRQENAWLRTEGMDRTGLIVGQSAGIRRVMDMVARVAETDATVLIRGESGTGKELVAQAIHMRSPRRDRPFIKVNAAAMPESLLESELFGHEKGAFTGAIKRKPGKFELARDGTLFLDEIGDISPGAQVRLLRVLQAREFERVGGTETLPVECRILTATNIDLEARVSENTFRQDLYYRLNVVPIHLPALRERQEDIPELVAYFLNKYSRINRRTVAEIPGPVMARFTAYEWPGNIRELENIIERAVVLGTLALEDLPLKLRDDAQVSIGGFVPGTGTSLGDYLDRVEREIVQETFNRTAGNKTRTAQLLGIERNLLRYKLEKFKIQDTR